MRMAAGGIHASDDVSGVGFSPDMYMYWPAPGTEGCRARKGGGA